MLRFALMGLLLVACGDDSSATDAATDTGGADSSVDTGGDDSGGDDAGDDAGGDDAGDDDAGAEDAGMRMLEDGRCRAETDCSAVEGCLAPGEFIGCGICMVPLFTCESDDDCTTAGEICDNRPQDCHCSGETTCRAGCTADSCDPGFECGDSGRCEPAACDGSDDCPGQFDCDETCSRRACDADADCDGEGWCVGRVCYETPGTCTPPVG